MKLLSVSLAFTSVIVFLGACSKRQTEPASPQPTASPSATSEPPSYGFEVPSKPGFVTSPYAPKQGYVDVRGFPAGTQVKDPYSGKIFLVPEMSPASTSRGQIQQQIQNSPTVDDPSDKNVSY